MDKRNQLNFRALQFLDDINDKKMTLYEKKKQLKMHLMIICVSLVDVPFLVAMAPDTQLANSFHIEGI